jgi:hypothetical protein
MRRVVAILIVLSASVAFVFACGTAEITPFVTTQWNVKSLTTKSSTGEVTRANVTGIFIFTSANQDPAGNDGVLPPAVGTFEEDITLSGVRVTQSSSYTITTDSKNNTSINILIGSQPENFSLKTTTTNGIQTMTWDSQDQTAAHWVLEQVASDAGTDAADGADSE